MLNLIIKLNFCVWKLVVSKYRHREGRNEVAGRSDNSFTPAETNKMFLWVLKPCRYQFMQCVCVCVCVCGCWESGTNCTRVQSKLHILHNSIFLHDAPAPRFAKKNIIPQCGVGVRVPTNWGDENHLKRQRGSGEETLFEVLNRFHYRI